MSGHSSYARLTWRHLHLLHKNRQSLLFRTDSTEITTYTFLSFSAWPRRPFPFSTTTHDSTCSKRKIMFRRSIYVLANRTGRTIVRDPRKTRSLPPVSSDGPSQATTPASQPLQQQRPLPFEPSQHNQESLGSSLVSYAIAGVGVSLGVILVRVVLGF